MNNQTNKKMLLQRSTYFNSFLVIGISLAVFLLFFIILGFFWTPHDPYQMSASLKFAPPSFAHPLGCDNLGRDILSRAMSGSKITFLVSVVTVLIGLFFGIVLGSITGYYGGFLDRALMRINDVMTAFPTVLLAIIFVGIFGSGKYKIMFILGLVFIPSFVRMVRGEVIKLKDKDFVRLSRLIGLSDFRIIFVHILPNSLPAILSTLAIGFNNAVLAEASLSFLGIGITPPDASLGKMLSESQSFIDVAPWYGISIGLIIVGLILSFGMISEGISRGKQNVKYSKFVNRIS